MLFYKLDGLTPCDFTIVQSCSPFLRTNWRCTVIIMPHDALQRKSRFLNTCFSGCYDWGIKVKKITNYVLFFFPTHEPVVRSAYVLRWHALDVYIYVWVCVCIYKIGFNRIDFTIKFLLCKNDTKITWYAIKSTCTYDIDTSFFCCLIIFQLNTFNDPEPDVPKDVTPMAQCAFESLMFNVSAVYTN